MPAQVKQMHYKCGMCGEEIEHMPHPTIASCPKCGRRGSFSSITTEDITDPPVSDPPVSDPPTDPVTDPPIE
jgi:predicted  nucleic acid-binding Zn-ribbon protein